MAELLNAIGEILAQNGLAGAVIAILFYYVLMQRAELRDTRAAHKIEIAEKEKLINQLQEARLSEVKTGFEIAKQNQTTLAALTTALRSTRG